MKSHPRGEAVQRAQVIDRALRIPALDRAVRLARVALRVPVAVFSVLTDSELIPIAVKVSRREPSDRWRERRRAGETYCKYVVALKSTFQVDDSSTNDLVRNAHATKDLDIGAYLGVPVFGSPLERSTGRGPVIGTLSATDHTPRAWSVEDVEVLTKLADVVSDEIAYRTRATRDAQAVAHQRVALLDAVAVGVLGTDANGVTTYANAAAERMLGYTAEELMGHDQHALVHHSHRDGTRYNEVDCPNYLARREGREFRAMNDVFWRIDGTPLIVDSTMTPIFDHGEVIGTVLTFYDVADRSNVIEDERFARAAAETANRAKTELLNALSREMQLPVEAIGQQIARLEASLTDQASPAQRGELAGIRRSQQHLLGLLQNMLQFAMLEVENEKTRLAT